MTLDQLAQQMYGKPYADLTYSQKFKVDQQAESIAAGSKPIAGKNIVYSGRFAYEQAPDGSRVRSPENDLPDTGVNVTVNSGTGQASNTEAEILAAGGVLVAPGVYEVKLPDKRVARYEKTDTRGGVTMFNMTSIAAPKSTAAAAKKVSTTSTLDTRTATLPGLGGKKSKPVEMPGIEETRYRTEVPEDYEFGSTSKPSSQRSMAGIADLPFDLYAQEGGVTYKNGQVPEDAQEIVAPGHVTPGSGNTQVYGSDTAGSGGMGWKPSAILEANGYPPSGDYVKDAAAALEIMRQNPAFGVNRVLGFKRGGKLSALPGFSGRNGSGRPLVDFAEGGNLESDMVNLGDVSQNKDAAALQKALAEIAILNQWPGGQWRDGVYIPPDQVRAQGQNQGAAFTPQALAGSSSDIEGNLFSASGRMLRRRSYQDTVGGEPAAAGSLEAYLANPSVHPQYQNVNDFFSQNATAGTLYAQPEPVAKTESQPGATASSTNTPAMPKRRYQYGGNYGVWLPYDGMQFDEGGYVSAGGGAQVRNQGTPQQEMITPEEIIGVGKYTGKPYFRLGEGMPGPGGNPERVRVGGNQMQVQPVQRRPGATQQIQRTAMRGLKLPIGVSS